MKKNHHPYYSIFKLIARLPLWGGIFLSTLVFTMLHNHVLPYVSYYAHSRNEIYRGAFSLVAIATYYAQFLLPLLIMIIILLNQLRSNIKKKKVNMILRNTQASLDDIKSITWLDFERLTGEFFKKQGYDVCNTESGADGGVDLILSKGRDKFFVQCKHWRTNRVSVNVARELFGVMTAYGASGGFIVASGKFTKDAISFCEGRNIYLLDGQKLLSDIKMMNETSPPSCPKCGAMMVTRVSKNGVRAGSTFLGCSRYPSCNGTR